MCLHVHACVYLVSEYAAYLIESRYAYRYVFFFTFFVISFSSFTLVVSRLWGPFRKREVHTCPHSKNAFLDFFSFLVNIVHRYIYTPHDTFHFFASTSHNEISERKAILFFRFTYFVRTILHRSIRITLQVPSAIMNSPLSCN